ncbi:hypothetical protein BC828DRAFT_437262 [Blastocladiella britannica]|nr:hypothetical protein BC828DRAFT_437262 [Blastocladiella britannica]
MDTKLLLLAFNASQLEVLEWFRTHDRIYKSIKVCMAKKYSLQCLKWAKTHGYLSIPTDTLVIRGLTQTQLEVVEWATADMASNELLDVLNSKKFINCLDKLVSEGLDWWWAHGPQFPSPDDFCAIVDNVVGDKSLAVIKWWWQKFLAHCTPTHFFGTSKLVNTAIQSHSLETATWLWDMSHLHPELFQLDWKRGLQRAELYPLAPLNLDFMRWWKDRTKELGTSAVVDITDLVESGDVVGLEFLRVNGFSPQWTHHSYQDAFRNQHLALLKWVHAHNNDAECVERMELPEGKDFTWSGTVNAELLEMYCWWNGQLGFKFHDTEEIGRLIAQYGYLPALSWWLSLVDGCDQTQARDLLSSVFSAATAPVVLDTIADFAHAHGFFILPPGESESTYLLDNAAGETQAWWRAFDAVSGRAPCDLCVIKSPLFRGRR